MIWHLLRFSLSLISEGFFTIVAIIPRNCVLTWLTWSRELPPWWINSICIGDRKGQYVPILSSKKHQDCHLIRSMNITRFEESSICNMLDVPLILAHWGRTNFMLWTSDFYICNMKNKHLTPRGECVYLWLKDRWIGALPVVISKTRSKLYTLRRMKLWTDRREMQL